MSIVFEISNDQLVDVLVDVKTEGQVAPRLRVNLLTIAPRPDRVVLVELITQITHLLKWHRLAADPVQLKQIH